MVWGHNSDAWIQTQIPHDQETLQPKNREGLKVIITDKMVVA